MFVFVKWKRNDRGLGTSFFFIPKILDSYMLTLPKELLVLQPLKRLPYCMYRINKEYCNDQVTLEVSDAEECLLHAFGFRLFSAGIIPLSSERN